MQPEKESVRTRSGIEEVAQFLEEVQIKAWGQWSEWGCIVSYIGEGIVSIPPPPSPPTSQFPKEEERGKWEDIVAAINFVAGNNGDEGGGRYV